MNTRILYVVNDPAFFISHRLPLAKAAQKQGYHVLVATGPGEGEESVIRAGFDHYRLPLNRGGRNPLSEMRLVWAIGQLYRKVRPDIVHLVTIKPVLYGGLTARMLRVPGVVVAISGMGYLFIQERHGTIRRIAEVFYRLALDHPNGRVIIQNEADRKGLLAMNALHRRQDTLIPGSGVDLNLFTPAALPKGPQLVVLPARMLWDKGVGEFVEAAKRLNKRNANTRFALVGPHDPYNPSAVPLSQLELWRDKGPVEWWGQCHDMPQVLAKASLVVLPSYREGMPKALLEAAAAGRAILTTDAPGCRDVVEPGKNGELVPVRDTKSLARTMELLLKDRNKLESMGRYSRKKAEAEFGIESVVSAHLEIYRLLAEKTRRNAMLPMLRPPVKQLPTKQPVQEVPPASHHHHVKRFS